MTKTYRLLLLALSGWLAAWIWLSWAAIQDDALIHLRYADNLSVHRFITYDGVHPDYGASSLLYVALLAFLRSFTSSPDLARATSSVVHWLLFAGFAYAFCIRLPGGARVARLTEMLMLILIVMPSAVRWLDDGMETGLAVSFASLLAWLIHRECVQVRTVRVRTQRQLFSRGRYLSLVVLAFLAVMLRTELVLLCGIGFLILTSVDRADPRPESSVWRRMLHHSHLLTGAGLAIFVIVATMHVLLPDTAVAKSHGLAHWFNPIHDTAVTLGGAFSFGTGMFLFWLITLALVAGVSPGRIPTSSTLLANALFPVVLGLASLRGQEIQGVRYFAWTLFFSIVWNILELESIRARSLQPASSVQSIDRRSVVLLGAFLVLLVVELPFETQAMFRVLTTRSETMKSFESQHLEILRGKRGVASDIGYIGYFTQAGICDLAGLVNGRAAARLTSVERDQACARTNPDFLFGNVGQLESLAGLADFSGWVVCGQYDFANVRTLDTHFVAVRPSLASQVCRATGAHPEPLAALLSTAP